MTNREITSFDLDILGEIGNIGSGNAATALSVMLNKKVSLEVPLVKLTELPQVSNSIGGPESLKTGIFFGVNKALKGYISFIFDDEDVERLCKCFPDEYQVDKNSTISEIANIISGAYVGAIAGMINNVIDITPPEVGHDMIGALIDSMISSIYEAADKTVIIGTKLTIDETAITGFYVLLLEQESLNFLLDYFNFRK